MNGIVGFAEMLDYPNLTEERRKEYIDIIKTSSHQLLHIINDILEISALESHPGVLHEESVNFNNYLEQLASIYNYKAEECGISLILYKPLPDEDSYLFTDPIKLSKVLSNLIENAIKFTPKGYVELGYTVNDKLLEIYVKDTGIGISKESQEIIFDRFCQEDIDISRSQGGLGLGLSIAKAYARLLGGDITLNSQKGVGSTFFIIVPYKKDTISKPEQEHFKALNIQSQDSYTILVAEDEEVNYQFIEALFKYETNQNYKLIHAKNGKEAVDYCNANPTVDLILMDIKMPVMNGHEATRIIKSKYPDLPVIAQTAYTTDADKEMAISYGCNDFITKPINRHALLNLINKYIFVK